MRRNRAAFAATSAGILVILLALVGLAISNVLITQERTGKAEALHQTQVNEETAKTQLRRAEENLYLAIRAVDRLVKWGPFGIYPYQTINEFMLPDELVSMRQGVNFYLEVANRNDNSSLSRLYCRLAYDRAATFQLGLGNSARLSAHSD